MSSRQKRKKHWGLRILVVILCLLIGMVSGVLLTLRFMPTRIAPRTALTTPTGTPLPDSQGTPTPEPTDAPEATSAPETAAAPAAPGVALAATATPAAAATPNPTDAPRSDAAEENDPVAKWAVNTALSEEEWLNVLLLGTDAGDPNEPGRSDTMIIASVNMVNGQLKLTSLMRDMYVPIDGHGKNKITSAHWFGGVDLAIKTVNQAFGMNITHYVVVDFSSFAYIVDAIGGVELPVTETERDYVNRLMADMRQLYPNIALEKNDLDESGDAVHLDGMQTLAYSRIRKLDSDFQRTSRQRLVLNAILHKMRSVRNPITLYQLLNIGLDYTRTSVSAPDAVALAIKVLTNGADFEELRLPADGTYFSATYNGQSVLDTDLAANAALLHDFIYGEDGN